MPTPKHILVPIDLSGHAERALTYAVDWARAFGARLTLLYVLHIPPLVEADLPSQMGTLEDKARSALERYLQEVRDAGVAADMVLIRGVPWQEIVTQAEDRGVDLIVMGTHGRTGLEHVFLGSVAERVVRHAPCPVLVTRLRSHPADS